MHYLMHTTEEHTTECFLLVDSLPALHIAPTAKCAYTLVVGYLLCAAGHLYMHKDTIVPVLCTMLSCTVLVLPSYSVL
jgi:hypothetical protein